MVQKQLRTKNIKIKQNKTKGEKWIMTNTVKKLSLTYIGMDSLDRPVYENKEGKLFKDADPREHRPPVICTVCGGFDGEPDTPVEYIPQYKDLKVEFIPRRKTW